MLMQAQIPEVRAEVCLDCPGYCESIFPYDVAVQGMLLMVHEQLSLP